MSRIKKLSEVRKPCLANRRVRDELMRCDMYLWELANLLNVSESTMTRMMRKELPAEYQDELIDLIRKGARRGGN